MPATGGVAIPRNSRNGMNHAMMFMLPTIAASMPSTNVICHFGKRVNSVDTTSVPWNIFPALPVTVAKIKRIAAGNTAAKTAIEAISDDCPVSPLGVAPAQ